MGQGTRAAWTARMGEGPQQAVGHCGSRGVAGIGLSFAGVFECALSVV